MFTYNRNLLHSPTYSGIFAEDRIRFKALADSSGVLKVPTAGHNHSGSQNCTYDWHISVDGGPYVSYSGTGGTGVGKCITVASGLEANSEHIIEIRVYDVHDNYGWALAFGWHSSGIESRLKEIIVDSTFLGFAVNATSTGNYFRYYQYCGCTNLINAYDEYLPATVLDTGTNFRCYQYYGCTSLVTPGTESAPNSITEIKDNFRMYQYCGCTSLINSSVEVMPGTVTYIGAHFRGWQYCNCRNITTAAAEVLPPNLVTIYTDFRCNQYEGCSNLVTISDEFLPNTVRSIETWFRLCQFKDCPKLTHNAKEAMSSSLTSLAYHYRHQQYQNCTGITRLDVMSVPNSLSNHYYCRHQWLNNTGNTTNKMTIYCYGDRVEYGDSGSYLDGNRVAAMYVPVNLVQGYRDSGFWSMVSDDKIMALS